MSFGIVAARTAAVGTRLTAGNAAARRARAGDTATVGRGFRRSLVRFRLRARRLVGRLFHDIKKYLVEHFRRSGFVSNFRNGRIIAPLIRKDALFGHVQNAYHKKTAQTVLPNLQFHTL